MSDRMSAPIDRATFEQAAHWYVQLADADSRARAEFQRWLNADPTHARAWARLDTLQRQFAEVAPDLAAATLRGAGKRRRSALKAMAVLLGSGLVTIGYEFAPWREWSSDARTGTGSRRAMQLADGSRLSLNTGTAINTRFDDGQRVVRLVSGEIFADVSDSLPGASSFIVETAEGLIRTRGARFDVRQRSNATEVIVVDRLAEIVPANAPERALRLHSGQRTSFTADQVAPPANAAATDTAWTKGMLVVNDWRLADFLAELDRYRSGHLDCTPDIANLRLSGAFRIDDTDHVLDNVAALLPVDVQRFTRLWTRVVRRVEV